MQIVQWTSSAWYLLPAGGIRDRPLTSMKLLHSPTKSWHSVLELIREAKVQEATEPGGDTNQISTFTNKRSDRVVSLYNKSWLWLAPTWEMPRSIYWGKDEWIKGIKVDPESCEYFYYGTQKKFSFPFLQRL